MNNFKSGFVTILGRPNVGKSTLLNNMLAFKASIVTHKAQTTRDNISGIYTDQDAQIVFIDTPGIHKAFNELGKVMNDFAYTSIDGVDLVLFIDDLTKPFDDLDQEILTFLGQINLPLIILFNKRDLVSDEDEIKRHHAYYAALKPLASLDIVASSSIDKAKILSLLKEHLAYGPMFYPEDQLMDKDERFLVKEVIREKVLLFTNKEVPYSVAVEVDSFKEDPSNPDLLNINCTIITERPTQKMIIIGDKGQMIKKIGRAARLDLQKLLDKKIYLELFVKVENDWRNRKYYLKAYGYKVEK